LNYYSLIIKNLSEDFNIDLSTLKISIKLFKTSSDKLTLENGIYLNGKIVENSFVKVAI
jgi:hypothetical protein